MTSRRQRGLIFIAIILAPFIIGLLFTYEIIKIPFLTDMADQPSIGYQEGPRILPPEGAVPVQGPSLIIQEFPVNPVESDEVSLQRGAILYDIHCQLCHGSQGHVRTRARFPVNGCQDQGPVSRKRVSGPGPVSRKRVSGPGPGFP